MSRLFEAGDSFVFLSEWDFVEDDGGVELLEEFLNGKIGGFDASAMLNVSDKGRMLWHITWFEPRKKMDLYYSCPTAPCISQKTFFKLADSLYGNRSADVDLRSSNVKK